MSIYSIKKQSTVRFKLYIPDSIPTKTEKIFMAGNFNGWHTSDKKYQFRKGRNGLYTLSFVLENGDYQYKIVRGEWQKAEVSAEGGSIENRVLQLSEDTSVNIKVANWADNFQPVKKRSTAAANVHFLDTAFVMPQLGRSRRIWIYLPKDYFRNNDEYSVIYMQDGQNVFDEATAYSGEWAVDDYLNTLPPDKECIVVAVDNGGGLRMNEYNPFNSPRFGKGEGDRYASFLAETLKPFVDKHYRTKKSATHTTVAGSSMGGLISFYIAVTYPEVFGNAGVFSPSFWVAPKLKPYIKKHLHYLSSSCFYFYGGAAEGENMVGNAREMQQLLRKNLSVKTILLEDPEGVHSEKYWRRAFPAFYQWLKQIEC